VRRSEACHSQSVERVSRNSKEVTPMLALKVFALLLGALIRTLMSSATVGW